MRRAPAPAAILVMALLVASCGGAHRPAASGDTATTVAVLPDGAQVTSAGSQGTVGDTSCNGGRPTASLRPAGPLPTPGRLPAGSYAAAIAARGYLIGGVDQNTLLWGYRDPASGQLAGFDIDMLREVASAIFGDASDAHLHLVVVPNAQRISAVQTGTVDIVAETMTITCEREKTIDFSTEYYDAGQGILVPSGSPITSPDTLAGKTVCAASGSTSLTNLGALPHPPALMSATNQTDCLVMLQQGQVDAISTDDTILEGLAAQDPNLQMLPGVRLSDEPYGMAISKAHPDFTRFVNAVLDRDRADGRWAAIWNQWLAAIVKTPPPAPPAAVYRD